MTTPFIPNYRDFPVGDNHNLQKQLVNSYVQTSTAINNRTVGTFELYTPPEAAPSNAPAPSIANGERWFPAAGQQRPRDGRRLVVQVADPPNGVLTVAHNITMINQVTRLYGAFLDGSNVWQDLPYVDVVLITNQIKLSVSATQIIVTKGATAPTISSGIVVLEYL